MSEIPDCRMDVAARRLVDEIRRLSGALPSRRKPIRIMEVCGTHTMASARSGLRSLLSPDVHLISGPGCPVCVTMPGYLDTAIELARSGVWVTSFGDLLHVPGSSTTLARVQAEGARVTVCYSPSRALRLAAEHPDSEIVFLAVGFETTIATLAAALERARREGLDNLSFLTAFKTIPRILGLLARDPTLRVDAFLCPGHVSAIIGAAAYEPIAQAAGVPCVIAGFDPLDILDGIAAVLRQLVASEARVDNRYRRVVRPAGNGAAQALMARWLQPCDASWRGIGLVPGSGLELRPECSRFDARARHGVSIPLGTEPAGCRCGEVIKGYRSPSECPLFGKACTPDRPVGPCMVSSEGSCAAAFRYGDG